MNPDILESMPIESTLPTGLYFLCAATQLHSVDKDSRAQEVTFKQTRNLKHVERTFGQSLLSSEKLDM